MIIVFDTPEEQRKSVDTSKSTPISFAVNTIFIPINNVVRLYSWDMRHLSKNLAINRVKNKIQ